MNFNTKIMKENNENINNEVTFLIMIDSSEESKLTVDKVIELIKTSGGKIELFYPIDENNFTISENQISTMRYIEEIESKVINTIRLMVEKIKREKIPVENSYTYGNIKLELKERLHKSPNITFVLNKKRFLKVSQGFNPAIKNFNGNILILDENSTFLTEKEVQLL